MGMNLRTIIVIIQHTINNSVYSLTTAITGENYIQHIRNTKDS